MGEPKCLSHIARFARVGPQGKGGRRALHMVPSSHALVYSCGAICGAHARSNAYVLARPTHVRTAEPARDAEQRYNLSQVD